MDLILQNILKNINATVLNRYAVYHYMEQHPEKLPKLFEIGTDLNNKIHHKAVWILESIAERTPTKLFPYVDTILDRCPHYKNESAIRGMSRIIYFIAVDKTNLLTKSQNKKIIEICLDWLIGNSKVATKVYAMHTMCRYAQKEDWIKEELRNIINKDFLHQTAGYKAAAKEVLRKINI
jgi:hypothetical protein